MLNGNVVSTQALECGNRLMPKQAAQNDPGARQEMSNASAPDTAAWHRRLAVQSNNAAWDLIEREQLDAGECAELVRLAATASTHWKEIGNADNIASAELLFGWALARSGAGPAAVDAAGRAFAHFSAKQSDPTAMAFPHAAMAIALFSAGDRDGHRRHYLEARRIGESLPAQERRYFEAAFRTVPEP